MPVNNLRNELERAQLELTQQSLLSEVMDILNQDAGDEAAISARFGKEKKVDNILGQLLDEDLIFDLDAILSICKKHKLKFIRSTQFEGQLPLEAIHSVKRIESSTGLRFKKFNLIVPSPKFAFIPKKGNPMLFAELPNGRFFFILDWKAQDNLLMDVVKKPFDHLGKITLFSLIVGIGVSLLVPAIFDDWKAEFFYRFFVFNVVSTAIVILAMGIGTILSKDMSHGIWNNKL